MAPPKIFITGATGYVGGDVLHTLLQSHPTWETNITCLYRTPSSINKLTTTYPAIKTIQGTLESTQILEDEAAKADIVLHFASSDHVPAAEAIKAGLLKGQGGTWIHTSGTDLLLNPKLLKGEKDVEPKEIKVFDDWEHLDEVISFPAEHSHRPVDKVVLSISGSNPDTNIKTAIVCPPTIFGHGRGTSSQRSAQIPGLAALTLDLGAEVRIPGGDKAFWNNIHIFDLSRLYLMLIDAAAGASGGEGKGTSWGQKGYYFAENGVHYWQEVATWIADEAKVQGVSTQGKVQGVTGSDKEVFRAEELLGWKPTIKWSREEVVDIVRVEAERKGLVKGN
ncbi:hypothetical protein LSUB1_G000403 [Lachnellula subtilissima]|uniref:NAD-dependent epimerase/dehydratase domain-containing protein n=1 Tax=Lachnellula subtilissima TaxID=602034 RepID=A0A8H8UHV4_9HELO|nr:hypothetical protein LSUB1_G000403 [Lachnellula subtilissima]